MSDLIEDVTVGQARTLGVLCRENPGSTWHFNDCGCCICLHPGGDKTQGYIIGPDGLAEYHEAAPHD